MKKYPMSKAQKARATMIRRLQSGVMTPKYRKLSTGEKELVQDALRDAIKAQLESNAARLW